MAKFINKIVKYILERRKQKLENALVKMKGRSYSNSTTKTHIDSNTTLVISSETTKRIELMDKEIKNIVKPLINKPEKILEYIEEHGTPVYRFSQAKAVLDYINEDEGFIIPLKGAKACWLNFAINALVYGKINLAWKSREMFVLNDSEIDVYYLIHQFHKWFGFKENLPGYDSKTQELFKKNLTSMTDESVREMPVDEIVALKEAIARDTESAEFVINLAKEISAAKSTLEKMQQDGGAQI